LNKKRKKSKKNILVVVLAVIVVPYLLYSIFMLLKEPTDVFVIQNAEIAMEEKVEGYIIREESIIQGENYNNGMSQIKSEGEKVAKNEPIFRYYTANEEELLNQIGQVDSKINEALNNQNQIFSSDIKALERQIERRIQGISEITDISEIQEYKKDINTYLNTKSKIAGELSPAGSYLKELYLQKNELQKRLDAGTEYIKASSSGVVSYRVDGLESVLTIAGFSGLNKDVLNGLNLKTGQIIATSNKQGKIVNNYECYIACIMTSEESSNSKQGDKVKLKLLNKEKISATIEYIAKNEDYNLVVFKITNYVEELMSYRKISFDVVWWSETGLKVPNSSIIYNNGLAYIIRNRAGYVDVLLVNKVRETQNYTIVEPYTTSELRNLGFSTEEIRNTKSVTIYDEIISNPTIDMLQ
jgi:putative membrane fusion protein